MQLLKLNSNGCRRTLIKLLKFTRVALENLEGMLIDLLYRK
nr:MAG TPA: hypothetical protein [Bacteriophage sp.]